MRTCPYTDALYFFVLQHQECFDVRWCRGTISEKILQPLIKRIERSGGAVLGGRKVLEVTSSTGGERPDRWNLNWSKAMAYNHMTHATA